MCRRIGSCWREAFIRSTYAARKITRRRPIIDTKGIDLQIEHSQIAGFNVDEEGVRRIQGAQQRRLANSGRA